MSAVVPGAEKPYGKRSRHPIGTVAVRGEPRRHFFGSRSARWTGGDPGSDVAAAHHPGHQRCSSVRGKIPSALANDPCLSVRDGRQAT
ncbi:hypothetical protein AB0M20_22660 [Actinoplanes sp. NPDC051633]|uniref:hypothetical protein n=1 Tax=Actinoplanes sp. NPDC051633 TaxID=3155670 RepID=UPI00342FD9A7